MLKICKNKHEYTFYRTPNGRGGGCPICKKIRHDNWIKLNPEKVKIRDREKYRKHEKLRHLANPIKRKANRLFSRFSLTLSQYNDIAVKQKNVCAICKKPERTTDKRTGEIRWLSVDHDHNCCNAPNKSCGKCIRGLLCQRCNQALGLLNENLQTAKNLISYIQNYAVK